MVSNDETEDSRYGWMGPLQYPNDRKQILITFIFLPIAAALFAFLMWKSAGAWM